MMQLNLTLRSERHRIEEYATPSFLNDIT